MTLTLDAMAWTGDRMPLPVQVSSNEGSCERRSLKELATVIAGIVFHDPNQRFGRGVASEPPPSLT